MAQWCYAPVPDPDWVTPDPGSVMKGPFRGHFPPSFLSFPFSAAATMTALLGRQGQQMGETKHKIVFTFLV